jgi:glycerol-3-phosphate dehydrogenase (NAD(P)+)
MLKKSRPDIAIVGDGGWGTTLAVLLAQKGYSVSLWGAFPEYAAEMRRTRMNRKFLPGIAIPRKVSITGRIEEAILGKDIIVLAVPSQYMRSVLLKIKETLYPRNAAFLSVTKGIEIKTHLRMSELIHKLLGPVHLAVLSGPTIAHELAQGLPTTAVIASHDKKLRTYLQGVFMTDRFRIYTNDDVAGVEVGGSLKNVIAIACGISDGLGFGSNAKAALLSRGLSEMARLGKAMGARVGTFSGLSGLGDLVTTCVSRHSRNRFVGEEIGKGKTLSQVMGRMQMVAEGVPTAKSAYMLAKRHGVDMPIIREIFLVLYKNKSPLNAVRDLMTRTMKQE